MRGRGRAAVLLPAFVAAAAATAALALAAEPLPGPRPVLVRTNAVGYRPGTLRTALVLADTLARGSFRIEDEKGRVVRRGRLGGADAGAWGKVAHHTRIDLTGLDQAGTYRLLVAAGRGGTAATTFRVGDDVLRALAPTLLSFLREQRCGYNPFLDAVCHSLDGRTAYGPLPAGSYVDARGGWHDAADQLKYLLTSSTVVGQLLAAHRFRPAAFGDAVDARGRPMPNGTPDVLDEARWGLDWMLRLHPTPEALYHQVADDRDHIGWKLPPQDTSDYGWGPGRERVVYFADGRPQGLAKYQSASDGMANLAGRYAAAMALAYQTWRDDPREADFARRCLRAGVEVYALGRAKEGVQQGNSYGAPYRYAEETWADDMEWGAAELFRATGERAYLDDALRYARLIGATSWMGKDTVRHYQYYPFFNLGHFALAEAAPRERRAEITGELAAYYRTGLEAARRRAATNAYGVGVPFVWCSNNFVTALATQSALYERMTGDRSFAPLLADQRDWLLGRNPWGIAMLTSLPGLPSPRAPHLSTARLTGREVPGGLVDGPVAESVFASLEGVTLSGPDSYADLQGEAVYHDDAMDYSTNEPTLDGTASVVLLLALIG